MQKNTDEGENQSAQAHEKSAISVIVYAPRSPDPKTFDWLKTFKVDEAAREAATAFGYQAGKPGLQTLDEPPRVLDNNKPLVAEHIKDGDKLEIIDTGGGVCDPR
jgi:hypothetical protein